MYHILGRNAKSDDIPLARSIECPCVLCYHEIKTFYILIIQRLIMIYHYEFALSSFVVLILLCILSLRRSICPSGGTASSACCSAWRG